VFTKKRHAMTTMRAQLIIATQVAGGVGIHLCLAMTTTHAQWISALLPQGVIICLLLEMVVRRAQVMKTAPQAIFVCLGSAFKGSVWQKKRHAMTMTHALLIRATLRQAHA
jgi:hypothetical protein